jgi:hypothetical protein
MSSTGICDFYCGDTRKYQFKIKNKITGAPISVHNGTLTVTFKSSKDMADDEAELQVKVLGVEDDIHNPTGKITVILSAQDTSIPPGKYYYDFQFVSENGDVTTILPILGGKEYVKLKQDVTRTTN